MFKDSSLRSRRFAAADNCAKLAIVAVRGRFVSARFLHFTGVNLTLRRHTYVPPRAFQNG
jgi:hypothetical protein